MKRRLRAAIALALALCLLCGCSKIDLSWFTDQFKTESQLEQESSTPEPDATDDEQTSEPVGTAITTEIYSELDHFGLAYQLDYGLDPYNCQSLCNRIIFSFLYEPLFAVDTSYQAVPILAESYEVSDDGLTTTIRLRAGVTFHNGAQLSAQDVVYSLHCAEGSDYYGNRLVYVTDIAAPDSSTVRVTTSVSYECLPLLLDMPIIQDGTAGQTSPPGTGPYRYISATRLARYDGWWQDGPALVEYDAISLCHTTTSADIRDNFEYENVNMVLTDPNSSAYAGFHNDYELWNVGTTVMQYIGYNISTKVFSNYGLRSAITYAIDRETLVADTMGGFAEAAVLPVNPQSGSYDVKLSNTYAYNIASYYLQLESASVEDMDADGILDLYVQSLGYAIPVSGTMIVCSSSYQRVQAATQIVNTLNSLGFDLTLKQLELTEYQNALSTGSYDLYYGEVRLSPNFDLSPFFRGGGSLSFGSLADSTMEGLCLRALTNSGNTYNLYQRLCDRGYITPVLFKSYALYTTRGAVSEPAQYLDWFLPARTDADADAQPEQTPTTD